MLLLSLNTWFSSLATIEKIYWVFALVFSLAFIIQLIFTFVGGDADGADGDVDAEIEGDSGPGFQFFTIKNMVAFFTIFGWIGLACVKAEMSNGASIAIAVASGLVMMTIMAAIFYFASKLVHSGTLNLNNAINLIGEVYLTIPANRKAFGKVQINVQGSLRELEAMTDDDEDLKTGSLVTVKQIVNNNILLVSKK
jgi:hypothetical protein